MFDTLKARYNGTAVASSINYGIVIWCGFYWYFSGLNSFVLTVFAYSLFGFYRLKYPTSTLSRLTGKIGTILSLLFCVVAGFVYYISSESTSFGIFDDLLGVFLVVFISKCILSLVPTNVKYRTSCLFVLLSFISLPIIGMLCPTGVALFIHCLRIDRKSAARSKSATLERIGRFCKGATEREDLDEVRELERKVNERRLKRKMSSVHHANFMDKGDESIFG